VAIVTGGAQGLGREYAGRLLEAGARVVVVDVAHDAAVAAAMELSRRRRADRVVAHSFHVADNEAVVALL